MSFFDSPVGRCEAVREMVLLDETQQECAREHGCAPGCACPLVGYFAERSGVSDPASLPEPRRAPQPRMAAAKARHAPRPSKTFVFTEEAPLTERKVA